MNLLGDHLVLYLLCVEFKLLIPNSWCVLSAQCTLRLLSRFVPATQLRDARGGQENNGPWREAAGSISLKPTAWWPWEEGGSSDFPQLPFLHLYNQGSARAYPRVCCEGWERQNMQSAQYAWGGTLRKCYLLHIHRNVPSPISVNSFVQQLLSDCFLSARHIFGFGETGLSKVSRITVLMVWYWEP